MNKIKNRPVALVTGAGRRLGRQIAYALAEKGFDLVINYNASREGALEAVEYIRDKGCTAIAVKADVSNRSQVQSMVKKAIQNFKKIDLLINNASVFIESPLAKTTDKAWNTTLDINLKGTFLCSQIVSKVMLKARGGRIINIASLGGLQAWKNHLPYSISKAGIIMLTKCLAKTLAPTIMVNAIAPGTISIPNEEGPFLKHVAPAKIPLRRYGKPSDITNLVIYLATTSNYITGQTIVVDGGRSI